MHLVPEDALLARIKRDYLLPAGPRPLEEAVVGLGSLLSQQQFFVHAIVLLVELDLRRRGPNASVLQSSHPRQVTSVDERFFWEIILETHLMFAFTVITLERLQQRLAKVIELRVERSPAMTRIFSARRR